jgi:hypothetical protein
MLKLHNPQTFCFQGLHPLAHPIHGLTKRNIFHFACDMVRYVCLTVAIKDLIAYGFAWFLMIHQSTKDVLDFQHDLLQLLGFNLE